MTPTSLDLTTTILALKRSPLPALRKLAVQETEDGVVISGSVNSYYLKQLAQETVMPLLGGRRLHNRVTVVRRPVVHNS